MFTSKLKLSIGKFSNFNKINKMFIGTGKIYHINILGANYQTDTNKVKMRGKFLKSRQSDMPTMLWFPEILESCENWEKWFTNPLNKILDYRNVWLLNARNFGDSDHHDSFEMEDIANDINRFLEEKQLTAVTIGGHGYGAKIACTFGSYFFEKTTGVMCLDGGPLDHSYHEAWEEIGNILIQLAKIKSDSAPGDVLKKIDQITTHPKWRSILKQNIVEGRGFKFNLKRLEENVKKENRSSLMKWTEAYGLYPGRAFALFPDNSKWIFLATNTIPFYKFFPKLEGHFPSDSLNFLQCNEHPLSHWMHEYPEEQKFSVMNRMARWIRFHDGVHVLLADRNEVGWFTIPDRESRSPGSPGLGEYVPEHVHHNYRFTDAYVKSKERRGQKAAALGEFKKGFSKEELW